MNTPLLIIDPGHGGHDPGGGSNDHFLEKDLVLQISLYQYERFQELQLPVTMTRTTDRTIPAGERARIVRESGARDCISNHLNAASANARGAETIHSIYSNGRLAMLILNELVAEGMRKRRVFTRAGANGRDYYYMHRETGRVETVIVEYGFATNEEDTKLLRSRWVDFAEAVVRAYCKYANHPYTPPRSSGGKSGEAHINNSDAGSLPIIEARASVEVEGKEEESAYIIGGRVYVPARYVAEQFNARVDWNNETKTATIRK